MSDQHNKSSSSDEWQKLDMRYDEFDVLVNDIDEHELELIGRTNEVPNLSAGIFTSPPFPVNGHILVRNSRFMVPMVCQLAGKPNKPSVNVWFLLDTGSPFTCLTMKSMKAILGANKDIHEDDRFNIAIQDQSSNILCQVSKAHFKEVNILGADTLSDLELWTRGHWKGKKFQLYKQ
ncbi:unnamed protein product [Caenorhabditis sp. 36 PRJEB53466]|nr:unnamed protein product [Caenorhabditis sp. 36 PRJEB53466]